MTISRNTFLALADTAISNLSPFVEYGPKYDRLADERRRELILSKDYAERHPDKPIGFGQWNSLFKSYECLRSIKGRSTRNHFTRSSTFTRRISERIDYTF